MCVTVNSLCTGSHNQPVLSSKISKTVVCQPVEDAHTQKLYCMLICNFKHKCYFRCIQHVKGEIQIFIIITLQNIYSIWLGGKSLHQFTLFVTPTIYLKMTDVDHMLEYLNKCC